MVLATLELGLADGKTLYTDSTHLKADANKKQFELSEVQKSTRSYLENLEADVNCDRAEHGKPEGALQLCESDDPPHWGGL